ISGGPSRAGPVQRERARLRHVRDPPRARIPRRRPPCYTPFVNGVRNIEATNNRRERELRRVVLRPKNWPFTWLDEGGEPTGHILSIVATCIAHDVNPRAYLHLVINRIVQGWPQAKLRELLPDRMLIAHPELFIGPPDMLPTAPTAPALA